MFILLEFTEPAGSSAVDIIDGQSAKREEKGTSEPTYGSYGDTRRARWQHGWQGEADDSLREPKGQGQMCS